MAGFVQAPAPPLVLGQHYSAVLGADGSPKQLGAGGYGAVWLFQDNNTQQRVAIKRMQLTGLPPAVATELYRVLPRELGIHYRLHHPHIACVKDMFVSTDGSISYINIVLEYVEGGALLKYVNEVFTADGFVSEDLARWLFQQFVITLSYLHAQNPPVSHRDLKLENALAQPLAAGAPGPIVKIVDFGLSTTGNVAGTLEIGTEEYKAPELIINPAANIAAYVATSVDIWATGVMLYAVLNMRYPWPNTLTPAQRLQAMQAHQLHFNRPAAHPLSAQCVDLLKQMLHPNPNLRITIQGIMQHPWFLQGWDPALLQINDAAMQAPPPNALTQPQVNALVAQVQHILWPQLPQHVQKLLQQLPQQQQQLQQVQQRQQQQFAPQQPQVALPVAPLANAVAANVV